VIIDKVGPAFLAYAVVCVVLVSDLLFLWVYSGLVRAKAGVAINPEDAARFGVPLSQMDPPEVARVLRAQRRDPRVKGLNPKSPGSLRLRSR
jgi:hypothetical protein